MKKYYLLSVFAVLFITPILAQVEVEVEVPEDDVMIRDASDDVDVPYDMEDYPEVEEAYPVQIEEYEDELIEAPYESINHTEIDAVPNRYDKTKVADSDLLPKELLSHPFIRYQHQVNEPGVAEAYPWISADALRMYFTKNNEIYSSERNGRYEDFGTPQKVAMDRNNNFNNAWLTNDELTMYCTNSSTILVFERTDNLSRFIYKYSFDLKQYISGFISAASFTPDMQTMMVYNSDREQQLVFFNMSVDGKRVMSLRKKLTVPFGKMAVGQISKNGQWLYFSVDEDPEFSIYKMNMMDLDAANPSFQKVLDLTGVRIGKPSLSYDETFMVFNATSVNQWQANELMVVDLNNLSFIQPDTAVFTMNPNEVAYVPAYKPTVKEVKINETKPVITNTPTMAPASQDFVLKISKIYPNPTDAAVKVEYHLPVNCQVAELFVQDFQGREVMRKKLSKEQNMFEFSFRDMGVAKGTYVVWINTELGTTETQKVIFQ